jgi:hypothetical protein
MNPEGGGIKALDNCQRLQVFIFKHLILKHFRHGIIL